MPDRALSTTLSGWVGDRVVTSQRRPDPCRGDRSTVRAAGFGRPRTLWRTLWPYLRGVGSRLVSRRIGPAVIVVEAVQERIKI